MEITDYQKNRWCEGFTQCHTKQFHKLCRKYGFDPKKVKVETDDSRHIVYSYDGKWIMKSKLELHMKVNTKFNNEYINNIEK